MAFESGVFPLAMDKAFAATLAPISIARKTVARAALVGFNEPSRALLAECFKQCGIDTVTITADAAERLRKEKFEACVLTLADGAEEIMEATRSSRSNSR